MLQSNPELRVLGIDRDPDATSRVPVGLDDPRLHLVAANFGDLEKILAHEVLDGDLAGALFDLGVSSHQLDIAGRGFSYHAQARSTCAWDRTPLTARTTSSTVGRPKRSPRVLREYGEERFAWRIANAIVKARPLTTRSSWRALLPMPSPPPPAGGNTPRDVPFKRSASLSTESCGAS